MKKIILLILLGFTFNANADFTSDVYSKVKTECVKHSLSNEKYFDDSMGKRCILIVQGIALFETGHFKKYQNNNLFNFRSPKIKKAWYDIGATGTNNGFIVFDNTDSSIEFAVDRFYKFDRYKTIKQIISGGCYISPVDNKKKCFSGFTYTSAHHKNYTEFVSIFYRENINNI